MTEEYVKRYRQFVDILRKAPDDFDFVKISGSTIISSTATAKVLSYFVKYGAASSWVLQVKLDLPEATVYRALKVLRRVLLVVEALRAGSKKRSRGGPRPVIWALWDATPKQVGNALMLHYKEYEKREQPRKADQYR